MPISGWRGSNSRPPKTLRGLARAPLTRRGSDPGGTAGEHLPYAVGDHDLTPPGRGACPPWPSARRTCWTGAGAATETDSRRRVFLDQAAVSHPGPGLDVAGNGRRLANRRWIRRHTRGARPASHAEIAELSAGRANGPAGPAAVVSMLFPDDEHLVLLAVASGDQHVRVVYPLSIAGAWRSSSARTSGRRPGSATSQPTLRTPSTRNCPA